MRLNGQGELAASFFSLMDHAACPLGPVGEELGFGEGINYTAMRYASPVGFVQNEPDFITLVDSFEAVRIDGKR